MDLPINIPIENNVTTRLLFDGVSVKWIVISGNTDAITDKSYPYAKPDKHANIRHKVSVYTLLLVQHTRDNNNMIRPAEVVDDDAVGRGDGGDGVVRGIYPISR